MTLHDMKQHGVYHDLALLAARIGTGVFLIDGVWDNVTQTARMEEFTLFVRQHGFPLPRVSALMGVYVQLIAGLALLLGLATRLAWLMIAVTFVVAIAMVHWNQSLRDWWPALSLVLLALLGSTFGGGRWSYDAALRRGAGKVKDEAA